MALLVDLHVLAQTALYIFSMACSLVVSIPLGVTQANFKGQCMLYTEFRREESKNETIFTPGSEATCRFPLYLAVFAGIFYATGMAAYYIYALCQKDPNIGSQMWVWPFTMANFLVTIAIFIGACIISVGFKTFCDNFLTATRYPSCDYAERMDWHSQDDPSVKYNGDTLYTYLHVTEGAVWVLFLDWVLQVALGFFRIYRNRKLRSQGIYADSAATGGARTPEDMVNIASVNPSA